MGNAITDLINFLEYSITTEKDPAEREELRRTLSTAKKVAEQRKKIAVCA